MNNWKTVSLAEVSKSISAGGTPSRKNDKFWKNGTINWLKISDLKGKYIAKSSEKITEEGLKNSSTKIFPKNTVLYSIFAVIGATGILKEESASNQAIVGIIPDTKKITSEYLYYCLINEKEKLCNKKSHATQDNINLKILREHKILLPSLDQQNKIVEILEKAEKLKEKRKKANELADEYLKSLFLDMFGKEENKFKLGEMCEIKSGGTPSRQVKEYWENGNIPWIGSTECKNKSINKPTEYITKKGLEKSSAKIFKKGTIVVALVGATIGKTGILNFDSTTNQNVAGLNPKDSAKLNTLFLFYILQKQYNKFMELGHSKFKMASLTFLKNLEIILPPIELQNKFAEEVKKVEKIKETQKESEQEIDNLLNSLMKKAFKGELMA